jgi:hypothetical protein
MRKPKSTPMVRVFISWSSRMAPWHLSDVLVKYENAGKYSTRVRIQATAIAIMGFAVGRAYLKVHPFMGVKYAAAFTSPDHQPRPALTEPEAFGHLLRKMACFEGRDGNLTGVALELTALTFVRPAMLSRLNGRTSIGQTSRSMRPAPSRVTAKPSSAWRARRSRLRRASRPHNGFTSGSSPCGCRLLARNGRGAMSDLSPLSRGRAENICSG